MNELRRRYIEIILEARKAQTRLDREQAQGLDELLSRTAQQVRDDIRSTPRGILGERFKREMLAKLEATIDAFRADYKSQLDGGIVEMARLAAEREKQLLSAVLDLRDREVGTLAGTETALGQSMRLQAAMASTRFGEVPRLTLERAYQRTFADGLQLSQRLYNLEQATRRHLSDTVIEGIAQGESARKMAGRIAPVLEASGVENPAYKARRIARTEINNAFREGHVASVTGFTGELQPWVSGIGWRLSPAHPRIDICDWWASDDSDGLGPGNYLPQNVPIGHPNCFTGEIVAAGPHVDASMSRWFEGEIVEIQTLAGNFLRVTPNHPILTPNGWVAAGLLHGGSYVFSCRNAERVARLIDPDDHQVPSLIEQIPGALRRTGGMASPSVPGSSVDFHGDGFDSQIDIVNARRLLGGRGVSQGLQPGLQKLLVGGNAKLPRFTGQSDLASVFPALLLATNGRVGEGCLTRLLFGGHLGHMKPDRIAHGASRDTAIFEQLRNGSAGASEALRDTLHGLSSEVRLDNVIRVRKRQFSGHVYNLQTVGHWYTASNIVTHNCKCFTVTILAALPDQQFVSRAARPELVPESQLKYYRVEQS